MAIAAGRRGSWWRAGTGSDRRGVRGWRTRWNWRSNWGLGRATSPRGAAGRARTKPVW